MLLTGGTHRSTVIFFAQKSGRYEFCGNGDDGPHDAALFRRDVSEERAASGSDAVIFHSG